MEQENQTELYRIRHSLAHVLAMAIQEMRPGTKLGFGPPIEDGFYYDFILPEPLTDADFPEIEKRMRGILKKNLKFDRSDLGKTEALNQIEKMGEPYKREYAQELIEKQNLSGLSFYRTGDFVDMCEGPHVESTKSIPTDAFKIRSIAGAYWRGDSRNQMMTRIYAWAFENKQALDEKVKAFKLALERDHKKLGKDLDIFLIDDEVGKGLPLWMPNGTVIRDELEKLMRELEFLAGYQRVSTPHLAKADLYYKTGHLPYYESGMYPIMEVKEKADDESENRVSERYCLRPMNCPHHHKIFASRLRSYRDLPIRYAEYGQVYRFEDSGALSGLLRVRGMCQNDAHIYCTLDQVKSEFRSVIEMHRKVYEILGLRDYYFRYSTADFEDPKCHEKFVNDPKAWEITERLVRESLEEAGVPFTDGKGEAAFYGPKMDVQFRTVTGREETASTCQLDFAIPERLGLFYKGADNAEHRPFVIHRAPLGSHERFAAFLIEHYGGAFPTWLAPVQVSLIPVSEAQIPYAKQIESDLRSRFIRSELDSSNESLGKRMRGAITRKIPSALVLGDREVNDGTVTLRRYGIEKQETMAREQFLTWVSDQIKNRAL